MICYSSYTELKSKYSNEIEYTSGGSGYNTLRTASVIEYFIFYFYSKLNSIFKMFSGYYKIPIQLS
jgi:hypothetical protein